MTNLLKWHQLDLPVFDSTEPLWHHFNLSGGIRNTDGNTLVRHCEMELPPDNSEGRVDSLAELLRIAEEQFLRLETEFGLLSVPHKWGLYPLTEAIAQHRHQEAFLTPQHPNPNFHRRRGYHLIPNGMLLAAKVVIVDRIEVDNPRHNEKSVDTYYKTATGHFLRDLRTEQAVFGQPRPNPQTQAVGEYIVDIEPRLGFAA